MTDQHPLSFLGGRAKPLRVAFGQASDKGLIRSSNEDCVLVVQGFVGEGSAADYCSLFAIADGVGGHDRGEIASVLALKTLASRLVKSVISPTLAEGSAGFAAGELARLLVASVKAANSAVFSQAESIGSEMGTTLAAVLLVNGMAQIVNVGDSRVYHLSGESLNQVTIDHSIVADMVARGEIAEGDIRTHPERNIITRCLGMERDVEVDLFTAEVNPGDALLLCSDGLWEMVANEEMRETLLKSVTPQQSCDELVQLANLNGGLDNVSAIVVGLTEVREQPWAFLREMNAGA